jgi:nucleoside-diphosphate-sugar epimerase
MRFDIVLNNLAGLAWTEGKIAMTSDGTPWRPLVHGLDIAQAIRRTLAAPRQSVHAQVFNVGSEDNNYTVREIAEIVAAEFPGCEVTFGPPSADNRSYKVAFDKIREVLPGFECAWDAKRGAAQLREVFERIDLDGATFTGRGHTRLKQIEYLLRTAQVDERLFWKVTP